MICATIFCSIILLTNILKTASEFKEMEREFGLKLPKTASLQYHVKEYVSWVDGPSGYAVMIYQLDDKSMQEFLVQATQRQWQPLPLNLSDILNNFSQYVPAEEMEKVPLELTQGLYKIKEGTYEFRHSMRANRNIDTRRKMDNDEPFSCTLGIADSTKNKIYLIKWDW